MGVSVYWPMSVLCVFACMISNVFDLDCMCQTSVNLMPYCIKHTSRSSKTNLSPDSWLPPPPPPIFSKNFPSPPCPPPPPNSHFLQNFIPPLYEAPFIKGRGFELCEFSQEYNKVYIE